MDSSVLQSISEDQIDDDIFIDSDGQIHSNIKNGGPFQQNLKQIRKKEFLESRTNVEFQKHRSLQPGAPEYIEDESVLGPDGPASYIIKKPFDIDYYYRKLPVTDFPSCEMPGITSSICVPKEEIIDQI